MIVTYRAFHDVNNEYTTSKASRKCLVLRYVDAQFAWVCGIFATMPAACKRADEMNHAARKDTH